MRPDGNMTRRRFVTLTAITGASLTLAGCGANKLPADTDERVTEADTGTPTPTATATPTATPTQDQEQTATEQEQEEDIEPGGYPRTKYQLAVHDTFSNGYPTWVDQDGRMYGRGGTEVMVSDDWWQTTEVLYSFQGQDNGNIKTIKIGRAHV